LFNVRIGYSFTYDAIAMFDYLALASGYEPLFDDGELIEYSIYPHFLTKNAGSGLRTITDTTMSVQTIFTGHYGNDKTSLKGTISKLPKVIAAFQSYIDSVTGDVYYNGGDVYSNDSDAVLNFIFDNSYNNISVPMKVYDNANNLVNVVYPRVRPNWWNDANY